MNARFLAQRRLSPLLLVAGLGWLLITDAYAQLPKVSNCTSAPPGLVGWWPAEANAGDSVNGNNGTVQPGAGFAAGMVGQAFAFNGATNSFVEVPDAPSLHATAAVTIEFWVKRTSLDFTTYPFSDYVLEKGGDWTGNQVNYGAALHTPAYNYCLHFTFAGGWRGGGSVADMNWHHCAIVARNGDANPAFYIDGVAQAVQFGQGASTITLFDSNRPLHIGAMIDPVTGWRYYGRELVDELSIYNRALSASEIQAIYNAGSAGKCPVNNWTNPSSAKWESPSWSLGVLPASDQTVRLMNAGYKAVNIDSATMANFPSSLTVGSLEIGAPTNGLGTLLLNYFGLGAPLKVLNSCLIGTNGTLMNLASSFEVDGAAGGALMIDGGTFTQEGGLTVASAPVQLLDGSLNATNATMNLGPLQVGGTYLKRGTFNQSGGTVLSSAVTIGNGRYLLESNSVLYALSGTHVADGAGDFLQTGGAYYGDVDVGFGYYYLQGGLLHGSNIDTITLGFFDHSGGTAEMQNVSARGLGTQFSIFPGYSLFSNGILHSATITLTHWGYFRQSGGTLVLTNQFNLVDPTGPPVRFELDGGNAFMPSLVVSNAGDYLQYGGTNQISGDLLLYNSAIAIYGGRLVTGNTGIGESSRLYQQGGAVEVTGVLSISGSYSLIEGTLLVNGVYLRGYLSIAVGTPRPPNPAIFQNTGRINFGGSILLDSSQDSMGQLELATNGNIYLEASPMVIRFADSSGLNWDTNSRLFINGWNGSYSGGGSNQLYFGTSSSGLTPAQVSLIRFVDPAGSPSGTYGARILSTGEVLPEAPPSLEAMRSGTQLVLSWPGNYQLLSATNVAGPYSPVSGASSPWTNSFNKPMEFFRLQPL